jgi:hypothetical protein
MIYKISGKNPMTIEHTEVPVGGMIRINCAFPIARSITDMWYPDLDYSSSRYYKNYKHIGNGCLKYVSWTIE